MILCTDIAAHYIGPFPERHTPDRTTVRIVSTRVMRTAVAALIAVTMAGCGGEDGPTAEDRAAASASASAASASVEAEASASASAEASASQSVEQQAAYDNCSSRTSELLTVLQELDSRLNVGLAYRDYGEKVGDVQVAYDSSVEAILAETDDCLAKVGVPLENAFNRYREVQDIWTDCIDDAYCNFSEGAVNEKVQKKWAAATKSLAKADRNLEALAPGGA